MAGKQLDEEITSLSPIDGVKTFFRDRDICKDTGVKT